MENALLVCITRAGSYWIKHPRRDVKWQRPALNLLGRGATRHHLHDEINKLFFFTKSKDFQDKRMAKRGNRIGLALKALDKLRFVYEVMLDDLDRYITLHAPIMCAIDASHATFTQQGDDFILPDLLPNEIRHVNVVLIR